METPFALPNFAFLDFLPEHDDFRADVLQGLGRQQKSIPAKYFYDARGSELFDRICDTPEYYVTRTELALMSQHAGAMAGRLGQGGLLIEYGSGASRKTPLLLKALAPAAYMPVDIAREQLLAASAAMARQFPGMRVVALRADYSAPLPIPDDATLRALRRLVYFPGSTIGNFTPQEAGRFLGGVAEQVGPGGGMLVGVDLKKAQARLDAAYNDAAGITARFNLNLLERINRELGGDFDLSRFRHLAFYNAAQGRIEMHLESLVAQTVTVGGRGFRFEAGETVHTENSYKYSVAEFAALAERSGFHAEECWTDPEHLFAVHYIRAR